MKGKLLGAALALTLLASGVTAAGASSGAARHTGGVTKDTIKLGITYVDLEQLRRDGVVKTNHGDYEVAYQAIIDDLNDNGGIGGRLIDPVIVPVSPLGTVPAQEACVRLTEDEQVFAVMGFFFDDAPICYLEAHETPIVGGTITEEYLARANAPWFSTEAGDAHLPQVIDALATEKAFKKPVVVVGTANTEAKINDVIVPALKEHGVKPEVVIGDAPPGDVPAIEAEADVFLQRFEADGVKTIVGVDGSEAGVADSLVRLGSDYRPGIIATTVGGIGAFARNNTEDPFPEIFENVLSAGPESLFDEPKIQKCFRVVEEAADIPTIEEEVPTGEPFWRISASTACTQIYLFKAIAEEAGKNLTVKSFGKAGNRLTSLNLPGIGDTTYDPKTHSYSLPMFIFRYDPDSVEKLVNDEEPVKGV